MENFNIKKSQFKVSDFLSWNRADNLKLNPDFQRRGVWKKDAKSYLIDTMVRGLPMPLIFLREQRSDIKTYESVREVVDGQQRLRTIIAYIDKSSLKGDKDDNDDFTVREVHNKKLAGKQFSELPDSIKERILDYEFSVHVLPSSVSDKEVLQIFARMNATGVRLNSQELRNAGYFGYFKTLMYSLSAEQLERWKDWRLFTSQNIARMDEVELTTELIQMMLYGLKSRKQKELDSLYEEYDESFKMQKEVEKRFRGIMDTIDDYKEIFMVENIFNKKTLFYTLFSIVYSMRYGMKSKLEKSNLETVTKSRLEKIAEKGRIIKNDKAPHSIKEALKGQSTSEKHRKILFDYLKQ